MRLFFALFLLLGIALVACQPEPGLPDEENPPAPDPIDLPKKIVEVEINSVDSVIGLFTYTSTGLPETLDVKKYESGTQTDTQNDFYYYAADKKIDYLVRRRFIPNHPVFQQQRQDQKDFRDAAGRISGMRLVDSATGDITYNRYEYDNRDRLNRVILELDSVAYFSGTLNDVVYIDSFIYDASNRVVAFQYKQDQTNSGLFPVRYSAVISDFSSRPNYIPVGINNYLIFENPLLLSGNNPGQVIYHLHDTNEFFTVTSPTIYDAGNRAIKTTFLNAGSGFSFASNTL
ncbi:MAG: hypothetical protein ABW019_03385, partial [Chitinophagaceae bacterium]